MKRAPQKIQSKAMKSSSTRGRNLVINRRSSYDEKACSDDEEDEDEEDDDYSDNECYDGYYS